MRKLIFSVFTILLWFSAIAQPKNLTGKITDNNGLPLSGASIKENNSTNNALSKEDGTFVLKINNTKSSITISYVGYEDQVIKLTDANNLTITLKPQDGKLQEVVVNALGFEAKKDRLGYATAKISGEEVANTGEVGLADALGGKTSGLRVSRTSGSDPGGASQILIRGQSTITRGTDPLIVLDGMPITSSARNESSGGTTQQSRLNDINPEDIASIQVLKGASAAALWGTKAANGVLVITTKKGAGGKTNISFKTTYSIDKVSDFYDLQNTYGQGTGGVYTLNNSRSWGDKIANRAGGADSVNLLGASFIGNSGKTYYPILKKNSKDDFLQSNYDGVIGTGHYLDNSLTISSGDSKANYYFSLSDLKQDGIIRNASDYRRSSVRFNSFKQMNKWLTVSNKSNFVLISSDRQQTGVNNAGFMIGLLRTPADFDNSDYIGKYAATQGGGFIENRQRSYRNYLGASANPGFNNPMWDLYQLTNTSNVNRFINSAEININPVSWFNLTVRSGVDYLTDRQINYFPYFSTNGNNGIYNRNEFTEFRFNLDVIARAEKKFSEKFSGNILFGFNMNSIKLTTLGAQSSNFIIPAGPWDLDNATPSNIATTDLFINTKTNAGYSSIGFSLLDQIFLNATGRIEAASTFGELSNKAFFYPSTDIAWQFSKLSLFDKQSILSFGKLRTSFGIVGIQPQSYQTQTNFASGTFSDGWGGTLDPGLYGVGTYIQSVNKGNAYLRPEQKQEIEVGADLRFFNNRLSTNITFYQNKTIDALINIPQASSNGFNNLYANAGSIQNKGIEIDLSYSIIKKKDWDFNIDATWSKNKNEVLSLNGSGSINLGGTAGISSRAVEGYPLGELYSIAFVKDASGKQLLNANGFPIPDVVSTPIGDPNPEWRGTFGFHINYKRLYVKALIEHSHGGVVANGTEAVLVDYGTSAITGKESTAATNLKKYDGTTILAGTTFRGNIQDFGAGNVALDQSWYTGPGGFFGNVGELFLEDATWTRFRELSVGYNLRSSFLKKMIGVGSMNFELSGRNLFLISQVHGYDPDSNVAGSTSARGVVYFVNPPYRSFLFTVKVNF